MQRKRIGRSFPKIIVECMRTGRRPDADEICSVAALIEVEAQVCDPTDEPLRTHEPAIRAALHATGIPSREFEDWLIELGPMTLEKGER